MNQNPSSNPAPSPEVAAINERVNAAVRSHQRNIRALTGAALFFGFLALTASIVIVSAYFVFYRPKQLQLLRDVTVAAQSARARPAPAPEQAPGPSKLDFPSVQATMTHVLSFATMLVAIAVGLSAAGSLVMLALVFFQRRSTLHQVNASLAQISNQLLEMQVASSQRRPS